MKKDSHTQGPIWVDEALISAELAQLAALDLDPQAGLFGPDSMFWEVNRHTLVYFLGAVQSVQMQLCHPWVATAVYEHSKIMTDPRQRARLTYLYLWSLIYGDLEMVNKKARALYKVHQRVQGEVHQQSGTFQAGSLYGANEAGALLWVHVTAFWCRVNFYEKLVRPLSQSEKDRFVIEAQRYALCFGIPLSIQPNSWADVEAYVADMVQSDTLARTREGLEVRHFLERSIPLIARKRIWTVLCVPLPAPLQVMLEQPQASTENQARATRTLKQLRFLQRVLPAKLRYVPAWHEATQRLAGKSKPDWVTARMNTLIIGQPRLVSRAR